MAEELGVVILADEGTRSSSERVSTLDRVCGQVMLRYVLSAVHELDPAGGIIVVGVESEGLSDAIANSARFVSQAEGGISACIAPVLASGRSDSILFLPSNIPLLTSSFVDRLIRTHIETGASLTFSPCDEDKAATSYADICVTKKDSFLNDALSSLPDESRRMVVSLIECYRAAGKHVCCVPAGEDREDTTRVDSAIALAAAARTLRMRKADRLIAAGVIIEDPERTYIDYGVEIAPDTVILPGSHLRGETRIGRNCTIGPDVFLDDAVIEDGCRLLYAVVEKARVRDNTCIGPYAHVRPRSDIGPNARIGNFVEVKASRVREGAKAGHLAYLGDADVGEHTNIGAGAITCNYDGKEKHSTIIGKRAFIGSNASLVAPVKIGDDALIGAGSTITEDVPDGDLALGRACQVNKERVKDEEEGVT